MPFLSEVSTFGVNVDKVICLLPALQAALWTSASWMSCSLSFSTSGTFYCALLVLFFSDLKIEI